jgi:hypothetical protein
VTLDTSEVVAVVADLDLQVVVLMATEIQVVEGAVALPE